MIRLASGKPAVKGGDALVRVLRLGPIVVAQWPGAALIRRVLDFGISIPQHLTYTVKKVRQSSNRSASRREQLGAQRPPNGHVASVPLEAIRTMRTNGTLIG